MCTPNYFFYSEILPEEPQLALNPAFPPSFPSLFIQISQRVPASQALIHCERAAEKLIHISLTSSIYLLPFLRTYSGPLAFENLTA